MPTVPIRIPQLGEGLAEAILVEFLVKPGDSVKRDEALYVMETDKANSEVESPYDGTVVAWTVEPGSVLPIGAQVGTMEVASGVKEIGGSHGPPPPEVGAARPEGAESLEPLQNKAQSTADDQDPIPGAGVRILMPPRTRKLLREEGLLDEAGQIPMSGAMLMPADVAHYLATGGAPAKQDAAQHTDTYDEQPLPAQQQMLNARLVRATQLCVPVTCMTDADWTNLDAARAAVKASAKEEHTSGSGGPTSFMMMLWCVVQTLKDHPRFRSALVGGGKTLRTYKHVNLGIAVALPDDLMVTAVVKDADTLAQHAFFERVAEQIKTARDGKDQVDASTTLSVSNMGTAGMETGIPAIVAPAVATLVLGKTGWCPTPDGEGGFTFTKTAKLALTFDHRVANGVGAGRFLGDVREAIESFTYEPAIQS